VASSAATLQCLHDWRQDLACDRLALILPKQFPPGEERRCCSPSLALNAPCSPLAVRAGCTSGSLQALQVSLPVAVFSPRSPTRLFPHFTSTWLSFSPLATMDVDHEVNLLKEEIVRLGSKNDKGVTRYVCFEGEWTSEGR